MLDSIQTRRPGEYLWSVRMDWDGGIIEARVDHKYVPHKDPATAPSCYWAAYNEGGNSGHKSPLGPHVIVACWARDEDRAVKITNERRLALIAEGKCPQPHHTP